MTDITTERRGDVTIVRLDRPKQLNALTAPMVAELHEVLEAIDADRTCRVVVLTGEGRGFCAGADLGTMSGDEVRVDKDPVAVLYGQKRYSALSARLRSLHQPVIAAVNGAAVGAGLAMVLACDVRLAASPARFSSAFVRMGLSGADMGVSWLLPRVVGAGAAHHLMLTGRLIDAPEALRIGLVLEVVDSDALLDRAIEHAAMITANSPFGVAQTKEMMWAGLELPTLGAAIELENRTQALANLTEDCAEAAAAFAEKRPAKFRFR
jgi:enoyl-CoA hydratase/carnithine racemase